MTAINFFKNGWHFRLSMLLALSLCLTGCFAVAAPPMSAPALVQGNVLPVQVTTALNGMVNAMSGMTPGTAIYQDPTGEYLLFGWPMPGAGGMGWAVTGNTLKGLENFVTAEESSGNLGSIQTWNDIKTLAVNRGWTVLAAESVPLMFRAGATIYLVSMTTMASSLPTFFMLDLSNGDLLEKVNQILHPQTGA